MLFSIVRESDGETLNDGDGCLRASTTYTCEMVICQSTNYKTKRRNNRIIRTFFPEKFNINK